MAQVSGRRHRRSKFRIDPHPAVAYGESSVVTAALWRAPEDTPRFSDDRIKGRALAPDRGGPAQQSLRRSRRRHPLPTVGRRAVQGEGVVGDVGDREGAIFCGGEQLADPLLDPPRPVAHR